VSDYSQGILSRDSICIEINSTPRWFLPILIEDYAHHTAKRHEVELVDIILNRARELKQLLLAFVLDAEGELATSLETYSAAQLSKLSNAQHQDISWNDLVIDMFLTEGKLGEQTPIELFLENQPELSESDRCLISSWQKTFTGLFAVTQVLPDGFELMNWMTAKHYIVKPNGLQAQEKLARLKEGEIVLTRIAPMTDTNWMFSGPLMLLGKLGKPKLAVAIGNFKDHHKNHLYSDAPELLEEAWQSVERYYQEFIDFFGNDEITLSGYQLDKKLAEFQDILTQRRLEAAGIDRSKSLAELVEEVGISQNEMAEAIEEMGVETKMVAQMLDHQKQAKMVMPKIQLPEQLRKAEQLTILTHPRWGQIFLTNYQPFKTLLETGNWKDTPDTEKLARQYLEDPAINAYVWYHLAHQYPNQLEEVLRTVLGRPNFSIKQDLDALLKEFNKPLKPDLPEIASVPLHLHNLFQEALLEVNKSKPKSKGKRKAVTGFQR
jgi:hypothetical protein